MLPAPRAMGAAGPDLSGSRRRDLPDAHPTRALGAKNRSGRGPAPIRRAHRARSSDPPSPAARADRRPAATIGGAPAAFRRCGRAPGPAHHAAIGRRRPRGPAPPHTSQVRGRVDQPGFPRPFDDDRADRCGRPGWPAATAGGWGLRGDRPEGGMAWGAGGSRAGTSEVSVDRTGVRGWRAGPSPSSERDGPCTTDPEAFPHDRARRTPERRVRGWRALRGPARGVILRPGARAGAGGAVGLHRRGRLGGDGRGRAARPPPTPLRARRQRLGARGRGARRREFRGAGRAPPGRPAGPGRRAVRAPRPAASRAPGRRSTGPSADPLRATASSAARPPRTPRAADLRAVHALQPGRRRAPTRTRRTRTAPWSPTTVTSRPSSTRP